MDLPDQTLDQDEALQRHAAAHGPVSDCPLLNGAGVTLLPSGGETLDAVFAAIAGARQRLYLQYYEFEDVHWAGHSLTDLLVKKLGQGVQVALSYDAAGSKDTGDAIFDRLRQAGAMLLEFRPLSPLLQHRQPRRPAPYRTRTERKASRPGCRTTTPSPSRICSASWATPFAPRPNRAPRA